MYPLEEQYKDALTDLKDYYKSLQNDLEEYKNAANNVEKSFENVQKQLEIVKHLTMELESKVVSAQEGGK